VCYVDVSSKTGVNMIILLKLMNIRFTGMKNCALIVSYRWMRICFVFQKLRCPLSILRSWMLTSRI